MRNRCPAERSTCSSLQRHIRRCSGKCQETFLTQCVLDAVRPCKPCRFLECVRAAGAPTRPPRHVGRHAWKVVGLGAYSLSRDGIYCYASRCADSLRAPRAAERTRAAAARPRLAVKMGRSRSPAAALLMAARSSPPRRRNRQASVRGALSTTTRSGSVALRARDGPVRASQRR